MNPVDTLFGLQQDFIDYTQEKFPFLLRGHKDLAQQLENIFREPGVVFQDPVLQFSRRPKNADIEGDPFHSLLKNNPWVSQLLRKPFEHQTRAWQRIFKNMPTVVATGTGSGKSESFMLPVINYGLTNESQKSSKTYALILYPMNALVDDQFFRWLRYTAGTGLKVGIYTGAWRNLNRQSPMYQDLQRRWTQLREYWRANVKDNTEQLPEELPYCDPRQSAPHILLTNYKMLDFALMRKEDKNIFDNMDLKYLVFDEAHMFSGTLALDMACLIARLKVLLGSERSQFVPIATSATLSRTQDQNAREQIISSLKNFFSQLFGHTFDEDHSWLIEENPLPLPPWTEAERKTWQRLFGKANEQLFPHQENFQVSKIIYEYSETELYQKLVGDLAHESVNFETLAEQFLAAVTQNNQGSRDWILPWSVAESRFVEKTGLSKFLFPAFLKLFSWTPPEKSEPLIRLRIHSFARPQPKILVTKDLNQLVTEDKASFDHLLFVSCRVCGHMALGAFFQSDGIDLGGREIYVLRSPSGFTDQEAMENMAVFHRCMDRTDLESGAWRSQCFRIETAQNNVLRAIPDDKGDYVRFTHSQGQRGDLWFCPSCRGHRNSDQRPIMNIHPSRSDMDLTIQSNSLLEHSQDLSMNRPSKLLLFSDSRQESARLAGFVTHRSRRLTLRRLLVQTLNALENSEHKIPDHFFKVYSPQMEYGYPLALAVLRVAAGKTIHENSTSFDISWSQLRRMIIVQKLPQEQQNNAVSEFIRILQFVSPAPGETWNFNANTEVGQAVLKLITQNILEDMVSRDRTDGTLSSLGLVALRYPELKERFREPWAYQGVTLTVEQQRILAHWLVQDALWKRQMVHPRAHQNWDYEQDSHTLSQILHNGGNDNIPGNSNWSKLIKFLFQVKDDHPLLRRSFWQQWLKSNAWQGVFNSDGKIYLEQIALTSDVVWLRSSRTGMLHSVYSKDVDLWRGISTGRHVEDIWQEYSSKEEWFSRKFYLQGLAKSRSKDLVLALEHNGMISAEDQYSVIDHFMRGHVNALVATPTLEAGVDLPDVPVVIHSSVPPDPSNYTQRSGRAGRDIKKALIHAQCGLTPHDLTFFSSPIDMVNGEILPPGMLPRNTDILLRHLNGLILQELCRSDNPSFDTTQWSHWMDLQEIITPLQAWGLRVPEKFVEPSLMAVWSSKRSQIENQVFDLFLKNLSQLDLSEMIKTQLNEHIIRWDQYIQEKLRIIIGTWKSSIQDYQNLLNRAFNPMGINPQLQQELRTAARLLTQLLPFKWDISIQNSDIQPNPESYPLQMLAEHGVLSNFQFPARVVYFEGAIPSDKDDKKDLIATRDELVALRELAPQAYVYGRGYKFQVKKLVVEELNRSLQLCSRGCSDVIENPMIQECPHCGAALIQNSGQNDQTPITIFMVKRVRARAVEFINDTNADRQSHQFYQTSRFFSIKNPDQRYILEGSNFELSVFHNPNSWVEIVHLAGQRDPKGSIKPFYYLDEGSGDARWVQVMSHQPHLPPAHHQNWMPYYAGVVRKQPAISIKIPQTHDGTKNQAGDFMERMLLTFEAALKRSIIRVLKIPQRSMQWKIEQRRIYQRGENDQLLSAEIFIFDLVPGGSGVIESILEYWDMIVDDINRLSSTECCERACYRCLKDFDNQKNHDKLDKKILQNIVSKSFKKEKWKLVASHIRHDDVTSEEEFVNFLRRHLSQTYHHPWQWLGQKSYYNGNTEITRVDFELQYRGYTWAMYLDGYQYHVNSKDKIQSDIEKRNFLASLNISVVVLPAVWFTHLEQGGGNSIFPKDQERWLKHILSVPHLLSDLNDLPPQLGIQAEDDESVQSSFIASDKDSSLLTNVPKMWTKWKDPVAKAKALLTFLHKKWGFSEDEVKKNLQSEPWSLLLSESVQPVGHCDTRTLLWEINADDWLNDKKNWQLWCLSMSLWHLFGYRSFYKCVNK